MNRLTAFLISAVFLFFFLGGKGTAISQGLTSESIAQRFVEYNSKAFQEKLFLHTDKEFYVSGEIAWFRIYYVDGSSHLPMQVSKVAYAEVLNEKGEPVVQAKISLDTGEGSFYLPTSLSTGNYTIRAYTNWMKNFDHGYFFEKKIIIVNTLKSGTQPVNADSAVRVNFFPEGGNLVSGLQSKLGFIVSNNKGGINDIQGYIVDQAGDTITSFSPLKFGIGSFAFKPVAGNTYKAIIAMPDGTVNTKELPEIYGSGYVMRLEDNSQGTIIITVYRKKQTGEKNTQQVVLAAHTRQVLHIAEKRFINDNDSTVFTIDKEKIGKGVTHFTLFSENGKPICERLFYIKPLSPAISLQIKADQATYKNRQKISLSVQAQYAKKINSPLDLSISVFPRDSLQAASRASIFEYMWLVSDLGGIIESPEYYFSTDPDVNPATDNLMLTHGWRRFRWDDVLENRDGFIKYLPEVSAHLVKGRVIDTRSGQPVANISTYLSISGKPFGFYTSVSDRNGFVSYEVKNYYGNGQVIAQPGIGVDSFYRVEILQPYAEPTGLKKYPPLILTQDHKDQLLQKSIGMQVQNIYSGDSLRNFSDPYISDTLPFFGLAENSYNLENYKRFTTMEEVLREYVREIGVGARNGKLIFRIFNPIAHDFYDGNELVLLDGVPVTDMDKIFAYDPLKIRRIDVLRDRYVVGKTTFNGVASFSTYEGMFDGFELNPRLIAIDYSGLQLQREFYSPVYETREQLEKRIPDFRNTLFWSPAVATGKDGTATVQFYTSDLTGKYIVMIQGMSENGDFVSGQAFFEVK